MVRIVKAIALFLFLFYTAATLDRLGQCGYWSIYYSAHGYDLVASMQSCIAEMFSSL